MSLYIFFADLIVLLHFLHLSPDPHHKASSLLMFTFVKVQVTELYLITVHNKAMLAVLIQVWISFFEYPVADSMLPGYLNPSTLVIHSQ